MKKDSLILYSQQYEAVKHLSFEDKGRLFDAIFHYHLNGDVLPDLPPMVSMAFSFIRNAMDIDMKKYEAKCQRNKDNINKRWNQTDTTVYDRIGTNTNDTDTETETETETETDLGEKSKRFVPPTPDEVKEYCLRRKNNVDPERFVNFYDSKGWMVGKNKMKDWMAAVRTWEKDSQTGVQPANKTFKTFNDEQ